MSIIIIIILISMISVSRIDINNWIDQSKEGREEEGETRKRNRYTLFRAVHNNAGSKMRHKINTRIISEHINFAPNGLSAKVTTPHTTATDTLIKIYTLSNTDIFPVYATFRITRARERER